MKTLFECYVENGHSFPFSAFYMREQTPITFVASDYSHHGILTWTASSGNKYFRTTTEANWSLYKQTNTGSHMKALKEYFNKHREVFYTLGIIILVDHFIFDGAFTKRLKVTINKLLDKVQEKLVAGDEGGPGEG